MKTLKNFSCFLLLVTCFFWMGCPDDDYTIDPCDNIICQNGGECKNGKCDCESPFTGKVCEQIDTDELRGTYVSVGYPSFYITIYKNSQGNLFVKNLHSQGEFYRINITPENTLEVVKKSIHDYKCQNPIEISALGTLGNDGKSLDFQMGTYIKHCNGNPAFTFKGYNREFEKVRKDRCHESYFQGECDVELSSKITGTYKVSRDKSYAFSGMSDPHEIVIGRFSSTKVKIYNLLRSKKWVTVDIDEYNILRFTSADLPIYSDLPGSGSVRTHSQNMIGRVSADGTYLEFETTLYSPAIRSWMVYEKK